MRKGSRNCFVLVCTILLSTGEKTLAQDHADTQKIYTLKPVVDYPLFGAAAAFTLYNFSQVSNKGGSDETAVLNLKKSDINWFDRWAVRRYSRSADKLSYWPFYVSIPLPLIFIADKRMKKDLPGLAFLYAEAMTMTGLLYSTATHYVDRYRPLVYSSESPLDTRLSGNSRNAFFAGHVALVATSTFFVARVFADYHPEWKRKWLLFGGAGLATAVTAYLRHEAGEHFPSDILLGAAVGTLSGLLTPALHRTRSFQNRRLTMIPFSGKTNGMAFFYKL